jgi:hypothetical protein
MIPIIPYLCYIFKTLHKTLTFRRQYGKIYDDKSITEAADMNEDREYYIDEFRKARESGKYYLYGEDPEKMTLEELKDAYMNMQNYLSDARTHDF